MITEVGAPVFGKVALVSDKKLVSALASPELVSAVRDCAENHGEAALLNLVLFNARLSIHSPSAQFTEVTKPQVTMKPPPEQDMVPTRS